MKQGPRCIYIDLFWQTVWKLRDAKPGGYGDNRYARPVANLGKPSETAGRKAMELKHDKYATLAKLLIFGKLSETVGRKA